MKEGGGKSRGYLAVGTQLVGDEEEFLPGNGETAAVGLNVLRMKRKRRENEEKAVLQLLDGLGQRLLLRVCGLVDSFKLVFSLRFDDMTIYHDERFQHDIFLLRGRNSLFARLLENAVELFVLVQLDVQREQKVECFVCRGHILGVVARCLTELDHVERLCGEITEGDT